MSRKRDRAPDGATKPPFSIQMWPDGLFFVEIAAPHIAGQGLFVHTKRGSDKQEGSQQRPLQTFGEAKRRLEIVAAQQPKEQQP